MRVILILTTIFALLSAAGCAHNPLERKLTSSPIYYLDNELEFQPKRIWRLKIGWEPYLLDDEKGLVKKELELVVHDPDERKRLEAEITSRGGDARYLRWLESETFPLGNWETRTEGHVARLKDWILVVLTTKSIKEVPLKGELHSIPVFLPDPIFRAARDGCHALNWDVIPVGDSVGLEIVLQSRNKKPGARQWQLVERNLPTMSWRAWSVGQGRSISYRMAIFVKNNLSRCPLPPKIYEEFKHIQSHFLGENIRMGIEW